MSYGNHKTASWKGLKWCFDMGRVVCVEVRPDVSRMMSALWSHGIE